MRCLAMNRARPPLAGSQPAMKTPRSIMPAHRSPLRTAPLHRGNARPALHRDTLGMFGSFFFGLLVAYLSLQLLVTTLASTRIQRIRRT